MNEEDDLIWSVVGLSFVTIFLLIIAFEKPAPKPMENRGGITIHIPQELVDQIITNFDLTTTNNNQKIESNYEPQ